MNIRSLTIIIIFIISLVFPVKSQGVSYASINIDKTTITALEAAFASELLAETNMHNDLKKISKHYIEASVAMSGIYLMKKNDRKALENERAFVQQEFYYYRLCCKFASLIMIKTLNITKLLAERPEAILQWGPYIYDVITKTKDHCKQFSAIVTNGKRPITLEGAAREIGWLAFGDEMIEILTLMRFANVDWGSIIDNFGTDFDQLTKDISLKDIGDALMDLFNKGSNFATQDIASAGADIWNDMFGDLNSNNSSNNQKSLGKTKNKIKQIADFGKAMYGLYPIINNPSILKTMFLGKLGLQEPIDPVQLVNTIFKKEYYLDLSSYANGYETPDSLTCYEQMWHIVRKIHSSDVVCDYEPGDSDSEWYFLRNPVQSISSLTNTDKELALQISEREAGWSRSSCEHYTNQTKGQQTYYFNSDIRWRYDSPSQNSNIKAIAYRIKVTRETNIVEKKYSAKYFSEKQNVSDFELEMVKKMYEFQDIDTDPRIKYEIVKDDPVYFEKPDTSKLKTSASVTYKVKCSDNGDVSSGDFWYKVTPSFRYKDLNSAEAQKKAIEYAMIPGVDSALDTDSVDMAIQAANDSIEYFTQEKNKLLLRRKAVTDDINAAQLSGSSTEALAKELTEIQNKIAVIENEIATLQSHLETYNEAKEEIKNDYYEQDNGNRIPSTENNLARLFKIDWIGEEGEWKGLTYTRKGTTAGEDGYQWTFTADLSLKAPEKRILGIRVHRSQHQIKWKLHGSVESEVIAYVLPIDSTWSEETKEAKVNKQLEIVKENYPDCSVSLEYEKIDNVNDEDQKTMHLLWPHERLDLARDLSSRLINIYSRLVEVERYIHYTKTARDWIKSKFNSPMRPPKRGNKADSCFRKWLDRVDKYVESNNKGIL